MGLFILFFLFFFFLCGGVPIAYALGVASLATFLYEGINPAIAFQRVVGGLSIYSLIAVPFFIFAGELMLRGGIGTKLVNLCLALVGRVRGGLGQVNVVSSMIFGGISGSAVADTSALGSMLIPVMEEAGYDKDYAVNVTVTSSLAGIVIPPSHNMVLYALAAGGTASISGLFIAGVIPGMLMCLALCVAAYGVAVTRNYPREAFPGIRRTLLFAADAIPGMLTGVIIVGGILSGIFTVTESAAIGVIYGLIVIGLLYRGLTIASLIESLKATVRTTAMVMILVATASSFAYLLSIYRMPELVMSGLTAVSDNPIIVLLLINLALLVLGCFMDMAALILICTPIFLPVAQQMGIEPVQFGILMMMNLGLGLTTPPVGACLFLGCSIGGIRMEETIKTIWPFYLAILTVLMMVTFIPGISLWLPNLLLAQ
ncbi:TRAP transporter large permease [Salipiger sp. PrR007]|uniref:TRAP transporter large permease n=1 Tax=Salipiger sp. PrR007 TaxID=2706884 RepID=UPI0013B6EE2D|nr:TRAP transporter large permease [Salipiger sp. PrR007]NDW33417.1 TRAP transporter large permease [Salipiger sp. PrR007]